MIKRKFRIPRINPYLKIGLLTWLSLIVFIAIGGSILSIFPSKIERVCKSLFSGKLTEREASRMLSGYGGWRGGGEDALFYFCDEKLNNNQSSID
ncbi:hypothetical protein [Prochlorococcus marinus]|uniref:hypothetical protein n=1 Tax=Prochlorococcus marinus TaxID=1219 RepID=UPI0022B3894E|nr:hypothetical protein [Prochlorococcus marinus]